jgi:hypothetical protein
MGIEFLHRVIWPEIPYTAEKKQHAGATMASIMTIVMFDLLFNCVLFMSRHYLVIIPLMLPYSLFEIVFPHLYNPIDLKLMFGIDLSFHPPMLTILLIIFSFPVFYIL